MAAIQPKKSRAKALPKENGRIHVDLDKVNPREQWGRYTQYITEGNARKVRHWYAPHSNGEQRTIAEQFLELEREAKVCQYRLFGALLNEVYGYMGGLIRNGNWWQGMDNECSSTMGGFAALDSRDIRRQGLPHGELFARATLRDNPVVEPHIVTKAEAAEWNDRERAEARPGFPAGFKVAGEVEHVKSKDQPQRERRERIGEVWVDLFAMEVRALLGTDQDAERTAAFNTLHYHLKEFQVGTTIQGAAVLERLGREGKGIEVLKAFERIRARLLLRLEEIAEEHADEVPNTNGQGQRLRWKGNTMELAVLIHELETRGWIEGGRTRSKLAILVATLFTRSDGEPLELSTLKTYMGKAYPRIPREGVEFIITENPDKTQ